MMKIRKVLLLIFSSFLLTFCNTRQDNNSSTQILLQTKEKQNTNSLVGEWKYNNTIWYTSELTLQNDGTFKFHDQGCYGQNFTKGTWTDRRGIIILSSSDSYRKIDKNNPAVTKSTENIKPIKLHHTKRKTEYTFLVATPFLPGPNDTINIYFDKVQFKLMSDTLYCLDKVELLKEHKFVRTIKPLTYSLQQD